MEREVTRLFDAMAPSYDELEPWYEHLYAELHAILRAEVGSPAVRGSRALDAGCGTGFQASILEALGWGTHGVDLSDALLRIARDKLAEPALVRGSLAGLPYREESFDVVTCCGSTLSFLDAPARALSEIGRVLRPGGRLLLECEHKWNLDLFWSFVSALTGDGLGYGATLGGLRRQLVRPLREGFVLDYPCAMPDGSAACMRLRLFTLSELRALLTAAGLTVVRMWGIHSVTNAIPSTVLHEERLSRPLAALFRGLRRLDAALSRSLAARRLANSLVILASKPFAKLGRPAQ